MPDNFFFCAYGRLNIEGVSRKQVKQLEPSLHCLRLHRATGQDVEARYVAPGELLRDLVRRAGIAGWLRCSSLGALYLTYIDLMSPRR